MSAEQPLPRVIVAVCTYRRDEPLRAMLRATAEAARQAAHLCTVGVVVVDDNPDASARPVVDEAAALVTQGLALGVHHRRAGQGNISLGRNIGIETALALGADLVAMTDDDCEPSPEWLRAALERLRRDDVDAVTGPCVLRVPPGSPRWLTEQPFLDDGQFRHDDDVVMGEAATNNSVVRASWLRAHPGIRFDPRLGVLGGEDMVFFRSAVRAGLRVRFVADAVVHGNESAERSTFSHRLRSSFWLGNTMCVTSAALGDASRPRLVVRGAKRACLALLRPIRQLGAGRPPQLRYATAQLALGVGLMSGALGARVAHH